MTAAHQVTRFAGRLVVAIDGTQPAVADTEANRVRFPKPRGGPNGEPGYPMVRMAAVLTAGTRSIIDAVFGTDTVDALTYAHQAIACLASGMVLLGERNFASYRFFEAIAATESDFLIRAKTSSTWGSPQVVDT
ncbi:transposase [Arthrobacter sp. SDTb3-6]|uniref:transposase n=1 Tax=Arthrobacter sp. SDTb3-6 TaxID=2713571 RepID=UPI00159D8739|nr:transposase [Arthrobacter sp. SDTb3-6]NVN00638.1 transposase [Arthrobacter sp. SDTb3-6]